MKKLMTIIIIGVFCNAFAFYRCDICESYDCFSKEHEQITKKRKEERLKRERKEAVEKRKKELTEVNNWYAEQEKRKKELNASYKEINNTIIFQLSFIENIDKRLDEIRNKRIASFKFLKEFINKKFSDDAGFVGPLSVRTPFPSLSLITKYRILKIFDALKNEFDNYEIVVTELNKIEKLNVSFETFKAYDERREIIKNKCKHLIKLNDAERRTLINALNEFYELEEKSEEEISSLNQERENAIKIIEQNWFPKYFTEETKTELKRVFKIK